MYDESRPAITVAKFPPVAIRIIEALSQLSLSLQGGSILLAWAWSPTPELRSINDNQSFFFPTLSDPYDQLAASYYTGLQPPKRVAWPFSSLNPGLPLGLCTT